MDLEGAATPNGDICSRILPVPMVDGTIWSLLSWLPGNGHRPRKAKHLDSPPEEGFVHLFNYTDIYFAYLVYHFPKILISCSASGEPDLSHQANFSQNKGVKAL